MIRRSRIILLILLLWPILVSAGSYEGLVVGVTDGDTLTVLVENKPLKIRLAGIDCPERKQAYGTAARTFTASLAFGQNVTVQSQGKDRYGRMIATVILPDGRNLNHEIIRAGFGWHYVAYARHDRVLATLQAEAQADRRGLWADSQPPVPPWTFRKSR